MAIVQQPSSAAEPDITGQGPSTIMMASSSFNQVLAGVRCMVCGDRSDGFLRICDTIAGDPVPGKCYVDR